MNPTPIFLGITDVWRSSRWAFKCSCGHLVKPTETILSTQLVECSKCKKEWFCDWNKELIKEAA